jgi:hypothetical protein
MPRAGRRGRGPRRAPRRAAGRRVALPVRPVILIVVTDDPVVVGREELRPGRRPAEIPIGHAVLHIEGGLDVVLPRLPAVDLLLADPQGVVDPQRLLGLEDAAAVADQHLGAAVLADGGVEDWHVGRQVLRPQQPARQDRPRIVVEDRNHIDVAPAEPVHVEVARVDRPDLVAALRGERHWLRRFRRGHWPRQTVELAVQGEDPPAGARAEDDAQVLQRGVQALFPEGGICPQLLRRRDRPQRHSPGAVLAGMGLRREPRHALLDPPLQRPIDGRATGAQIARDARGVPAFYRCAVG